jgi:hypothetical protein
MSLPHRHLLRFITALSALVLATPALAQAPPTGPAKQVEAEVRLSLKDAVRTAETDPAKAADKLRRLLKRVEADRSLPAERRAQLMRVVQDRLRIAEAGPDPAAVAATDARQKERDAEVTQQAEQTAKLKSGLEEALKLDKQGKAAEAQSRLDALLREYKDHPIVQAVTRAEDVGKLRAEGAETRALTEQRVAAALTGVDRAAVMPKDDIVFPKDFKQKTAARKADTAPTAAELKVLQALNTSIPADFRNTPLQDAVDTISTLISLPVVIDKGALDDNGLTYATPVTFVLKRPVAARTALRGILHPLGLTFVVTEGVVYATTPLRAREFLKVKVYNIADLVQVGWEDMDFRMRILNALMLIDAITSTVDPESWERRGGPGVIRYYDPLRALIVRQSAEVHTEMKRSLYK